MMGKWGTWNARAGKRKIEDNFCPALGKFQGAAQHSTAQHGILFFQHPFISALDYFDFNSLIHSSGLFFSCALFFYGQG